MKKIDKNPQKIKQMFDSIADKYDFLNGILSLYQDRKWRRKAAKAALSRDGESALDLACGTGNLTLELAKISSGKIVGIDFSEKMISIAKQKIKSSQKKSRLKNITFKIGDATSIDYPDESFDSITIGFGLRNASNAKKVVSEMARVVKKGGTVVVLELGVPKNAFFKKLYMSYFMKILPIIGGLVSGNKIAYKYLPSSVVSFYTPDEVKQMMIESGLEKISIKKMTFGACFICTGKR